MRIQKNYVHKIWTSSEAKGIRMITSFKRVIRHILLYTLKCTPVVRRVVQEVCNREVLRKPCSLEFIADIFKTQEMCNKAGEKDSCVVRDVILIVVK